MHASIHQIVTDLQQMGAEINPLIVQQRFYGVGQMRKQERAILQVIQAKMLDYVSVKMTERYARVLDSSIMRDMNSIRDTLNLGNK